jgi:hypothetical protein
MPPLALTALEGSLMNGIEDKVWVLALAFGAMGTLGVLHCLACGIRNNAKQHDLRVRVNELRNMQMQRLRDRGTSFGLKTGKKAA